MQSPVHKVPLPHLSTYSVWWSERNFGFNEVNEAGSKLCGMLVKGDCFIVHSSGKQGGKELLSMLGLLEPAGQAPSGELRRVGQQKGQQTARPEVRRETFQQLPAQHANVEAQITAEAQPTPPALGQCATSGCGPQQQSSTPSDLPCVHHPRDPEPCLKPLSLHEPTVELCEGHQHDEPRPMSQREKSFAGPPPARPSMESPPSQQLNPHPQPPEVPCWTDLPPEMISHIFQALVAGSKSFSACLPLMQTCRTFRQVALCDSQLLMRIWFNLPDVHQPFKCAPELKPTRGCYGSSTDCSQLEGNGAASPFIRRLLPLQCNAEGRPPVVHHASQSALDQACEQLRDGESSPFNLETSAATNARGSKRVTGGPQWALHSGLVKPQAAWVGMGLVPAPLARAAHYGNPSACGTMAQLLEVNGHTTDCEVMLYWRRCAKFGDVEAMLKLGFALYEGTCGCAVDVDAAHVWLSKALRALLGGIASLSQLSVDLPNGRITVAAAATPVVAAAAARPPHASDLELSGSPHSPSALASSTSGSPAGSIAYALAMADTASSYHAPVLTQGGLIVPGQPYTASLQQLLKVGCTTNQRTAAAAAALLASRGLPTPSSSSQTGRRLRDMESEVEQEVAEEELPPLLRTPQARARERSQEQRQRQQRQQREELQLAQRRLKRMEGQSEVARVAHDDPSLLPLLARAAELLGYIYFDGEAGIKADQAQACSLFKLATLAGSREAARVLGWIYSTGQYGG
ncbi:hypothetical protein DUNSADRAFT_11771 [Dunaliella salina]|uniref:F-box domain-containing protein n=1 Tax=Dunaliella salina TaxID=3046 RepID=A0ABQ7GCQ7_DUNSA|nr:hypothetical protein DUNSADRAFT_11771 [Dunaliella salina]|eukprot:KAF5832360.1 hypothetical protein DUNSADRAFT_11771 [Dunaliella salina]